MIKVSDQNPSQSARLDDRRREEQKRSERFSEFVRDLNRKDLRRRSRANGSDFAAAETNPPNVVNTVNPKPAFSSDTGSVPSQDTGGRQNPDINKLAAEIVRQFETLHYGGKVQGVNLTFNSEALQGLQVQIRQHQDDVAIRFVTNSESLSKLLTQNADRLRETLSQKGVRVKGIAVSAQAYGVLGRLGGSRTGEQNAR